MVSSSSIGAIHMKKMIKAVKQYALENYEFKVWSEIVECWSDEEIAAEISECHTEREAIACMAQYVEMKHDYIEDIKNA